MVPDEQELIIVPNFEYSLENELIVHCKEPLLIDLVKKCLILDPKQRITPTDALNHKFLAKRL